MWSILLLCSGALGVWLLSFYRPSEALSRALTVSLTLPDIQEEEHTAQLPGAILRTLAPSHRESGSDPAAQRPALCSAAQCQVERWSDGCQDSGSAEDVRPDPIGEKLCFACIGKAIASFFLFFSLFLRCWKKRKS